MSSSDRAAPMKNGIYPPDPEVKAPAGSSTGHGRQSRWIGRVPDKHR
jgi:hypothetical protein